MARLNDRTSVRIGERLRRPGKVLSGPSDLGGGASFRHAVYHRIDWLPVRFAVLQDHSNRRIPKLDVENTLNCSRNQLFR